MLTADEIAFLKSQGLAESDVYDGRNQSGARWRAGVRATGQTLVLGAHCENVGHRLRTRSGHCAQCNPANISYQNRYNSTGYVYIAGSLRLKLLKIGTAVDINQRLDNLIQQSYGGIRDWEMLFYAKVESGGRVEGNALAAMSQYSLRLSYKKDGRDQQATEIIRARFSAALSALVDAIGDEAVQDKFLSHRHKQFEFE
jgi:hypothetical protein